MSDQEPIEFDVEVSAEDSTEEDIDLMTRQLLGELRQLDVESAELTAVGPPPVGAKGGPIAVGEIAIEVLPAAVPALIKFVQAWMGRSRGRQVKFKGKGIEFEGSPEDLERLLAILEAGKRRK
jgi:hypothetical protein